LARSDSFFINKRHSINSTNGKPKKSSVISAKTENAPTLLELSKIITFGFEVLLNPTLCTISQCLQRIKSNYPPSNLACSEVFYLEEIFKIEALKKA